MEVYKKIIKKDYKYRIISRHVDRYNLVEYSM